MCKYKKYFKWISGLITSLVLIWLLGSWVILSMLPGNIFDEDFAYLTEPNRFEYQLSFIENKNTDKVSLWYSDDAKSDEVVLYLHGNAGRTFHLYEEILAEGYDVLSPAYPGYHESEGEVSDKNSFEAAELAYNWLLEKGYKENQIIIYGHSMGGAVAINLASKKPQAQKLVIVNTFASIKDMCLESGYGIFCTFANKYFPSKDFAQEVSIPVRHFHYENDKKVSYKQGQILSKNFTKSQDYKFLKLEAQTHSYFNTKQTLEE